MATSRAAELTSFSSSSPPSAKVFQTSFHVLVPSIRHLIISPPPFHEPPRHLIIATPIAPGTYPVILFKHGFLLANCHYTQLFESLASCGYIIVAPQAVMQGVNFDATAEIEATADVANWVSRSLGAVLNAAVSGSAVVPDMSKLVMAGHSRGGKIAFAMALGMSSTKIIPSFSALIALDPVDGKSDSDLLEPPLVASGCSNQLSVPVLIVGTEYGSDTGFLGMPPCAPKGCSHMAYFNCSSAPIMYHVVASDQGHLDFLNDGLIFDKIKALACKSGSSKEQMRNFSVDVIVAFLKHALQGEKEAMQSFMENQKSASITYKMHTQADSTPPEDKAHVLRRERMVDIWKPRAKM